MNSDEAKQILLAWRPDHDDARDPEVAQALDQSQRDPALRHWLEHHRAFQDSMRRSFRAAPVPEDLLGKILAAPREAPSPNRSRRWLALAAAAAVVFLLALAAVWMQPAREDSFATFRSRMVAKVLRQYTMTIVTNDMTAIRRHLAAGSAPANYSLPPQLAPLTPLGAGLLSWQDRKVSMVCLNSTNQGTLFLFVVDRSSVTRPPGATPAFAPVNRLMTASWSEGEQTYLLAIKGGKEDLQRYLEKTPGPLR